MTVRFLITYVLNNRVSLFLLKICQIRRDNVDDFIFVQKQFLSIKNPNRGNFLEAKMSFNRVMGMVLTTITA